MSKQKRTPLEKIQSLETKEVAKFFFYDYITPSIVTKKKHKKAWEKCREKNQQGFVMPYIKNCFKEWQREGFIETSLVKIPFLVERKKGKPYRLENYGYRLNLEPFYRYCKDNNVEFKPDEKKFVNGMLNPDIRMRLLILAEYPKEDIITAILKFYVKRYPIAYGELYMKEKLSKNSKELLNPNG